MPDLIRFDAPVGNVEERAALQLWPGAWFDATGFNAPYPPYMHRSDFHTGADLNMPQDADAHAPAYACCFGFVTFAGSLPVWGRIVTIKHALENGKVVWSRYAHLESIKVTLTQMVARGDQIGTIGNADGTQAYHLHFDIGRVDLGRNPGDWPGTDRNRLVRDYVDPLAFIRARHIATPGPAPEPTPTPAPAPRVTRRVITASPRLRVRAMPSVNAGIVGYVNEKDVVVMLSEQNGWGLIDAPRGWISLAWTQVVI